MPAQYLATATRPEPLLVDRPGAGSPPSPWRHAGQRAQEPDSDRAGDAAHGTVPCLRTVADLLHRPP
jgi:hypothetical protein